MHTRVHTTLLLLLFALGMPVGLRAQSSAALYEQALRKERTDGDLAAAIALYQRVAGGRDRELAARALVRAGEAYERLGRKEAAQTYQRVLREFADQTDAVATARGRLAALMLPAVKSSDVLTSRLVLSDMPLSDGGPTPDGEGFLYADWQDKGELAIRDFATGKSRFLTHDANNRCDYAMGASFSRDRSHIAYSWSTGEYRCWQPQLRIMNADGSNIRVLLANNDSTRRGDATIQEIIPSEFMPDGSAVLVVLTRQLPPRRWVRQMGFVSTTEGGFTAIRDVAEDAGIPRLSPDGKWIAFDERPDSTAVERNVIIMSADGAHETTIPHSVDDQSPIWSPDGQFILFASRRTGNVGLWAVRVKNGAAVGDPALIKGDMPWAFSTMGFAGNTLFYQQDAGGGDVMAIDYDTVTHRVSGAAASLVPVFQGQNMNGYWSADGRYLTYLSKRGIVSDKNGAQLVVRDMQTGKEQAYEYPRLRTLSVAQPSADGKYVFISDHGIRGTLLETATERFRLLDTHTDSVGGGTFSVWSHHGHVLYAHGVSRVDGVMRAAIVRHDLDHHTASTIRIGPMGYGMLAVSPNDSLVAFQYPSPDGDSIGIGIVEIANHAEHQLVRLLIKGAYNGGAIWQGNMAFTPDGKRLLLVRTVDGLSENWQSEVISVDLATGAVESTGLTGIAIRDLTFAPDGRLTFTEGPDHKLEIWTLDNWQRRLPP